MSGPNRMNLRPYQERGVRQLLTHPRAALLWDMGLGKTAATLTAISHLVAAGAVSRVLIVAPKRVAISVWPAEVAKWAPWLSVALVVGAPKMRTAAADADVDIRVINFDNLVWLSKHHGAKWPYDMVVVDEASMVKHHASNRSKALRRVCRSTARWVNLTGTPAPNGVGDLWHQVYLLDQGKRLYETLGRFRDQWFTRIGPMEHNRWAPRFGAASEIVNRIGDICFALKTEDYLDLPPVMVNDVLVDMSRGTEETYKKFQKSFYLEFPDGEASSPNAAAAAGKCLQFANGALYLDDTEREWGEVHTAKLDALAEVLEESGGTPVLLFYSFESDRKRILKRFKQARHIDDIDLADWDRGVVPLLLAHPASAGHGLNLQAGGNIAVWFGLPWNLEHYQQANKRLHRSGQTKPVVIHRILTRNTLDTDVTKRLAGKAQVQNEVIQGLAA